MRITHLLLTGLCFGLVAYSVEAQTVPGDADGNGVVNLEDARTIARYLTKQILSLPNPTAADATQDGVVDMEDAFAIAQRVTGQSRFIVVAPDYGDSQSLSVGRTVRIDVFERFFPLKITAGTVRIRSATTGYDSGNQPLTSERDGRSLYYHWDTAGLAPARDYSITVSLIESAGLAAARATIRPAGLSASDAVVALATANAEPRVLASSIDASCPTPGIALEFRRVSPHDSGTFPYSGPLGRGWMHNFDVHLQEFTDGRIAFLGANGFNRWFTSKADGTYAASPGDYGILTRDPDGSFQLGEKGGLVYHFRPDLLLDYLQDRNGNRISALYDTSKRLVQVSHSSGASFYFTYNITGLISKLTDHVGRQTVYEYDNLFVPIAGFQIVGYDSSGFNHLLRVIQPGNRTNSYTYSLGQGLATDHRLLSFQSPDGTQQFYNYDSSGRVVSQEGAWAANRLDYSYFPNGVTRVTDLAGGISEVTVDDQRDPVAILQPNGGIVINDYDGAKNLVRTVNALGQINQFAYDRVGNRIATTNAEGEVTTIAYESQFQQPAIVIDPLGRTNVFNYDANGDLTAAIQPDGTAQTFSYDNYGNRTAITDAAGNATFFAYNQFGLPTVLTNALGNVNRFAYDSAGDLAAFTNAQGNAITFTRDALGRITRRTYADGSHEDLEYDGGGRVSATTNRRGQRITFAYDANGRLEWKTYPSGKQLRFRYDPRGLFSGVEDIVGGTTNLHVQYDRDLMGQLTFIKVPGPATPQTYDVSFAYDAAGRRSLMAYPDGYVLHYQYDEANRLTRISDTTNKTIVTYQYDAGGRRTRRDLGNGTYTVCNYDSVNRLTALTNFSPVSTVQSFFTYTYNAAGMRASMTTLEGKHNYSYDSTYQVKAVQYPNGRDVQYQFDVAGNRTKVIDNGVVTNYTANALAQYTQVAGETFTYDADGNLAARTTGTSTTSYGWDEDGNLVNVNRDGVQIACRYDYQGRLIAKTISGQETRYVWDGVNLVAEVNYAGQVVKRYIAGAAVDETPLVIANGTNYWCQHDGLGSVVATSGDNAAITATCAYDIYGNVLNGDLGPVQQRLGGMWWDKDVNLYYVRARWYSPIEGCFISMDPLGIASSSLNLYVYVENDPINFLDLEGLKKISPITRFIKNNFKILWPGGKRLFHIDYSVGKLGWHFNADVGPLSRFSHTPLRTMVAGAGRIAGGVGSDVLFNMIFPQELGGRVDLGDSYYRYEDENVLRGGDPNYFDWSEYPDLMFYQAPDGTLLAWGGGLCPTFIQVDNSSAYMKQPSSGLEARESLDARISIPINGALLRSDIPIFGIAGGKEFKSYHVEIGVGLQPKQWDVVESSKSPQTATKMGIEQIPYMQGDIDIRGNLATWNTGLKEWVHLPWHPPEEKIDYNGLYTIRLVVEGQGGNTVEDRVTCEVGCVIAQCLPGTAVSPDQRVTMRFPEQALMHPFRVYTILPLAVVDETAADAPSGCRFVSDIYRIREPGDRFIKDVQLEFTADDKITGKVDAKHIGLCRYDDKSKSWLWVKTISDASASKFHTVLNELPSPRAIYALAYDPQTERSFSAETTPAAKEVMSPVKSGVLVEETFEKDLGTFELRDRWVGAVLSRDSKATPNGTYCLKLVKENQGGNFSVTVLDRPFNVEEYPILSFDYRITADVKTDFLLKVAGRWYNLRFTDDPIDYRNRDVNIVNLGAIEGVLADGAWHKATVDFRKLLRQQTRHTRVDEIVMADWDVTGYMKLEFGRNARGATYYLDNFKIVAGPAPLPDEIVVNDFEHTDKINALKGPSGTFSNPGTDYSRIEVIEEGVATNRNRCLKLTYDTSRSGAYCGYWTALMAADLSEMDAVKFRLRTPPVAPSLFVGLRHAPTRAEARVLLQPYLSAPDLDGWRHAVIPMTSFTGRGLPALTLMDTLFFTFENSVSGSSGTVFIDDIQFSRQGVCETVADISAFPAEVNLLGGGFRTRQTGAAAISAGYHEDRTSAKDKTGCVRISYGGKIGHDYGQGQFSYAIWETDLMGIDARSSADLVVKIRGEKGGEKPNFYLDDGMVRRTVRAKELPPLSTEWQEIRIPLEKYAKQGIDLSRLHQLQFDFEWEEMSGTIYVAKVSLAPPLAKQSLAQKAAEPTQANSPP